MKILVETTGQFSLVDYSTACNVHARRPSVVKESNFIAQRMTIGQLKHLGALNDEATDEEFAKYWKESEGDAALAIHSFMSSYGADAVSAKGVEPEPEPEPEPELPLDPEEPKRRGRPRKN